MAAVKRSLLLAALVLEGTLARSASSVEWTDAVVGPKALDADMARIGAAGEEKQKAEAGAVVIADMEGDDLGVILDLYYSYQYSNQFERQSSKNLNNVKVLLRAR